MPSLSNIYVPNELYVEIVKEDNPSKFIQEAVKEKIKRKEPKEKEEAFV